MDDVVSEIVLSKGNPNLLACELEVVTFGNCLGTHEAQIRSALRFGKAHGSRPLTGDELREVIVFLLGVP